jgi:hypothetical protein
MKSRNPVLVSTFVIESRDYRVDRADNTIPLLLFTALTYQRPLFRESLLHATLRKVNVKCLEKMASAYCKALPQRLIGERYTKIKEKHVRC